LPKQWAFLASTADEVLFSGAYGAGKTVSLCVKLLSRVLNPRAREGLFRLRLQDLYSTTLKTLLEGDGDMPPLLPPHLCDWNKARREIRVAGGGTILYGEADPDKIQGMNLTGAGVDQAEELDGKQWNAIAGRLRAKAGGMSRQLYGACNPGPPAHHLAKRFGIKGNVAYPHLAFRGDIANPIRCEAIMTESAENPHLPPDYLARLAGYTGVLKARYVKGCWVGSDALIYDRWQRDLHMVSRLDAAKWSAAYIAVDDAYSVPFAALLLMVRDDGAIHVLDEVYRTGMLESDKIQAVRDLVAAIPGRGKLESIVVDPAAASLKANLRANGFRVEDGINDPVTGGIFEVQQLLAAVDRDKRPMLTVAPTCSHTAEEFESYEWADTDAAERPVKKNDHAMDAIRYGVMRVKRPAAAVLEPATIELLKRQAAMREPVGRGRIVPKLGESAGVELEVLIRARKQPAEWAWDKAGPWRIWEPLTRGELRPNQARPYVMSISTGAGSAGSLTCIKIGDAESRTLLAQGEWDGMTPEQAAREAVLAGLWVGGLGGRALAIWKAEGPGQLLGAAIKRLGYGRCYTHIEADGRTTTKLGWDWTAEGSQVLLGRFRGDLERGRYTESDPATATDLARWAYAPNGAVGPVSLDNDGDTQAGAADRGWAAVLLGHAYPLAARLATESRKPDWGSIEWIRSQEPAVGGVGGKGHQKR
jgi:hypothetical protein